MKIVEVYLVPEKYNPRVKASIPGCWMAVRSDGNEYPVCPDYAASNANQVFAMLNKSQSRLGD